MDTIEQVLSLPSHSEVLPSLPRVWPAGRVRTCMRPGHASTHGPGLLTSTSLLPLSGPLFRGVGDKTIQSFNLSSLLQLKA